MRTPPAPMRHPVIRVPHLVATILIGVAAYLVYDRQLPSIYYVPLMIGGMANMWIQLWGIEKIRKQ